MISTQIFLPFARFFSLGVLLKRSTMASGMTTPGNLLDAFSSLENYLCDFRKLFKKRIDDPKALKV